MSTKVATVMTQRDNFGVSDDLTAKTKASEPDITVVAKPWYVMVLVRVARVYLQSLLGLLAADFATTAINWDFVNVALVALSPALVSLLQNSVEILSKLDTSEGYAPFRA